MISSLLDLLALPLIGQGTLALWEGIEYLRYCRESVATPPPDGYAPRATVFAPCKGVDDGLRRSLEVMAAFDYPAYDIVFIVESATDPAHGLLTEFCERHPERARLVVAGTARRSGQKVHNLLRGLEIVDAATEVFVFLDSDVELRRDWLRRLVAPLADPEVGATTGFRWFTLETGGPATILRSAWNAVIANTMGPHRRNFAWGGSMAMRRDTFDRFGVAALWDGAASDDYALTEAVRRAKSHVKFVPNCLVASPGTISLGDLFEFTNRQIIVTRVYNAGVWKVALAWYWFYSLVLFDLVRRGMAAAVAGEWATAHLVFLVVWGLSYAKGALTLAAVGLVLGDRVGNFLRRTAFCLAGPVVAVLYAVNTLVSCFTRKILWRGILYELRSTRETLILKR